MSPKAENKKFDIIVLGSGPGGYVAALKAAQLGASCAIVEAGDLGGTCLNNGCIPSKALLASGSLMHTLSHEADALGIKLSGEVSFDWPAIQKRKDRVIKNLRTGIKGLFGSRGVKLFNGFGRLTAPGEVSVTGSDGKVQNISAPKIIIATGSTPMRIPGWPDDPNFVCTSDEALHWDELPKRLVIIGGGVIGCEFACMTAPMGVKVDIVEMMPRLLPEMDGELADMLQKDFKKRDIGCRVDTKVEKIEIVSGEVKVSLSDGSDIIADRVLVAAGRRPATADIGLENVGIKTERGFIGVDENLATSADGIYCIGDANGKALLAHAASDQGVYAVKHALGQVDEEYTTTIPWCVYTFPELAGVGLTEQRAIEKGLPIAVGTFPIGHLGKAMAVNHTDGVVKVIRNRQSDELLGVHMLGHNATEIIAAAACMITTGAKTHELAEAVFAHPTLSEAVKEAAEDAFGAALHLPARKMMSLEGELK